MTVTRHTGDALETVATLPDDSVDLVATSPPFLALRNYNNIDGQWGSEPTPAAFLDHLLELTVELRRVLTPTGSIAIELGDSYAGGNAMGTDARDELATGTTKYVGRGIGVTGLKSGPGWPLSKSLTGIPTLYTWSLAYGHNLLNPDHTFQPWRIRSVIVWARNNPPVGALGDKYRPATSYITVACPSGKRWFDLDAVRTEPTTKPQRRLSEFAINYRGNRETTDTHSGQNFLSDTPTTFGNSAGAPPLDHWDDQPEHQTWNINTHGSSLAHYAMWPPTLAERLILSMCPAEVCVECKEPRKRITENTRYVNGEARSGDFVVGDSRLETGLRGVDESNGQHTYIDRKTLGWSDCGHGNYRPGHVLDPFMGTGTTLCVSDIHGRDATGIDLDPANPQLYAARYAECWRALKPGPSPVTPHGTQLGLLDSEAT